MYWLQMKLKEMGYYKGTVTGQFREGTKNAVKAYQQARGLSGAGTANASTLNCLYNEAAQMNIMKATGTPASTQSNAGATPTPASDGPTPTPVPYQPGAITVGGP